MSFSQKIQILKEQSIKNATNLESRGINIMYPPSPLTGARGDGSDETKIIQAIINYAKNGDTLFIPDGTFVTSYIEVTKRLSINGTGVIKLKDNTNTQLWKFTNVSDFSITGITFDGNKEKQTSSSEHSLQLSGCSNVIIDKVTVRNHRGNGFIANNSNKITARSCKFYGNVTTNGIYQNSKNCKFIDCYSWGSDGFGLQLKFDCQNCDILNCHSFDNKREGFNIIDGPKYCNLIGNHAYRNGDGGIVIGEDFKQGLSQHILIQGNYCFKNHYDGININNTKMAYFRILGNECFNNNQSNGLDEVHRHGIFIANKATNIIIEGNICYDDQHIKTQEFGLFIGAGAKIYVSKSNNFNHNKLGKISEQTAQDCNNIIELATTIPTNQLSNPSFETWDTSLPAHWTAGGAGHSLLRETTMARSRFSALITANHELAFLKQDLNIHHFQGSRLKLGMWVHCKENGGAKIALYAFVGGSAIASTTKHSGTGWEYLVVERPVKDMFTSLFVRCEVSPGNKAIFDEGLLLQAV